MYAILGLLTAGALLSALLSVVYGVPFVDVGSLLAADVMYLTLLLPWLALAVFVARWLKGLRGRSKAVSGVVLRRDQAVSIWMVATVLACAVIITGLVKSTDYFFRW